MANFRQFPTVPENARLEVSWLRSLVNIINSTISGKLNCTGEFTCTTDADSTSVSDPLCTENSVILLMPSTADAGIELAGGDLYIEPGSGAFVVYHGNITNDQRTFRYVIAG